VVTIPTIQVLALLLGVLQAPAAPAVDLRSLLAERSDPASLARLPEPWYRLRLDSAEVGPVAGLPEHATTVAVLEGPGALVRIEVRGGAERVEVRLDDAPEPVLVWAGGRVLELPVPFAKRCRITCGGRERGTCEVLSRVYPGSTAVTSATSADLERVRGSSTQPTAPLGRDTFTFSMSEEIPEGALVCIDPANAAGPRAITQIHLRAEATELAPALRRAVLRLAFDGVETVAVPLGDFFATFPGAEAFESGLLRVAPGVDEATGRPGTQVELVSRFVMPYRERFDLAIDTGAPGLAGDLHVAGIVRTMPWTWDERSLRFGAAWRSSGPLRAGPNLSWHRLTVNGSGILAAESLVLGVLERAPTASISSLRTDGADLVERMALSPTSAIGWGAGRRLRGLDAVTFDHRLDLATVPACDPGVEFQGSATTYWYSRPGSTDDRPDIREADRTLPILGGRPPLDAPK
jgi:hypothetical protein